jgi:hypothetical protein
VDPLITVDDLKTYLQADVPAEAAELAAATASGVVRGYCGWHIAPQETTTFIVDGNGTAILTLPTLRLTAVDKVRVNDEVWDAESYRWQARGQLLHIPRWPAGMANIEVDATHGYTDTPDAIRAVALAIAAGTVDNPTGRSVIQVGLVRSEYDAKLSQLQYAQLAGFVL